MMDKVKSFKTRFFVHYIFLVIFNITGSTFTVPQRPSLFLMWPESQMSWTPLIYRIEVPFIVKISSCLLNKVKKMNCFATLFPLLMLYFIMAYKSGFLWMISFLRFCLVLGQIVSLGLSSSNSGDLKQRKIL